MSAGSTLEDPKWWQWPTVLSLDAPTVAIAWQWMFAHSSGVRLQSHHYVLLGVGVWMIYAADRWIEGWSLTEAQIKTQRHRFYLRSRWPVLAIWIVALAYSGGLALRTATRQEAMAGGMLSLPVIAYLLSHQFLHRNSPWRVPKEICIGILFALGCALFPAVQVGFGALLAPMGLFAGACFINCMLIATWERDVDASHGQTSLALQSPWAARMGHALPWLLSLLAAGAIFAASDRFRPFYACLSASGFLMGVVDRLEPAMGRKAARVLVDLSFLTPFLLRLYP